MKQLGITSWILSARFSFVSDDEGAVRAAVSLSSESVFPPTSTPLWAFHCTRRLICTFTLPLYHPFHTPIKWYLQPVLAEQHSVSQKKRRSKTLEGDLQCYSNVDPSGKLYDSGKPNTTQLCAGSSAELRCCCWKVISNPKGLWGGKSHSRDTKKRPGPECRCSRSPTEHTAHRNLPSVPSALSQTPFTDSDLLGLSQIWVQLQHRHERGRRLLSTDCL